MGAKPKAPECELVKCSGNRTSGGLRCRSFFAMVISSSKVKEMEEGSTRRSALHSLAGIFICCALVVTLPFVFLLVLRVLVVGAPIALIGGILIFFLSYLENRNG